MKTPLKQLKELIPKAKTKNLPTLEQISNNYQHDATITIYNNPKLFVYQFLKYSDLLVEAASIFENQILVECGTGRHLDAYVLAEIVGAKCYISIEPSHMKTIHDKLTSPGPIKGVDEFNEIVQKMYNFIGKVPKYDSKLVDKLKTRMAKYLSDGASLPVALIAEDMLDGLKRIPSSSVSVLASGIDKCIIPEDNYALEVEKELSRVIHPQGNYLGFYSRFKPNGLKKIKSEDWVYEIYAKN